VPGTFTYDPPAGTILDAGDDQVLSLNFVPDDPEAYNSVSSFVTIDVDKNYLVVRADDQSMREGEMVPELTLSYSGFMNGEGPEVLDSPPSAYTQASPTRPAGDYPIALAAGPDNNYWIMLIGGTVTILENIDPIIHNMPADITLVADQGFAHATVSWTEPTATDNVGVSSFTSDHSNGGVFPMGTTIVTYTARDAAGNQSTASFSITVNKNDPVITWTTPEAISYGTALGATQLNASSTVTGTFTYDPSAGTFLNAGTAQPLLVSFVPDNPTASNSVSSSTTIDVAQAVLTITAEDKSMNQGEAIPELTLTYAGFVNSEEPGVLETAPTLSTMATAESQPGDYDISITGGSDNNYTFTLQGGTLTILDITEPVIANMPADITVFADQGQAHATLSWTEPTASDNVGVTSFTADHDPGETFPVGTSTVTYTVSDAAGNQATASFSITVNKNDPVLTWNTPANISYGTTLEAMQLNASSTAAGTFSYDPPTGTHLNAGLTQTLSVSFIPDDPAAYTSASASTTIDVDKALLTVSADNKSIKQGQAIPELTLTYAGFVNSEEPGVLETAPTLSTTATAESPAGDYDISITGGSDNNYTFTLQGGTLTILSTVQVNYENQIQCAVYPNPAKDGIRIKGVEGLATFTLYNMNGVAVITRKIEDNAYISLSGLKPAMYVVDIQSSSGMFRTKILMNRD
jgi:hypothetical protein